MLQRKDNFSFCDTPSSLSEKGLLKEVVRKLLAEN